MSLGKCAVEEEKHNEIIGLGKSNGLQQPRSSLWGMGQGDTCFLLLSSTPLSFSVKAILSKTGKFLAE